METLSNKGSKHFELCNHLGNVLSVVSDKLSSTVSTSNSSLIADCTADIVSSTDYYPFGMVMPGRVFNSDQYRYGFNGMEKDEPGMGGGGATYDYGFRIYNPQIAKFLSVDPLMKSFPWYTPYQFAGNKPVAAIDLDGLEEKITILSQAKEGWITEIYIMSDYTVDEWNTLKTSMACLAKSSVNFEGAADYNSNSNTYNKETPDEGSLLIISNQYGIFSSYDKAPLDLDLPKPNPEPVIKDKVNPNILNPQEFDFTDSYSKFKDSYEGKRALKTMGNYVSLVTLPVSVSVSTGLKIWNVINIVSTLDNAAGGISDVSFSDAHIDNDAIKAGINTVKLGGILGGSFKSVTGLGNVPKTLKEKTEVVINTWQLIQSPVNTAFKIIDIKENLNKSNDNSTSTNSTIDSTNSTIDSSNESK